MKKVLSLVLALVFALSLCAFGEAGYVAYNHSGKYSLEYPEGWLMIDAKNIASLLNDTSVAYNYNVDVSAYTQQILGNDMVMFSTPSGNNFNVVSQYIGQRYSAEDLIDELVPALLAQYEQIMPGVEIVVKGDIREAGGKEYAYVVYSWNNGYNDLIGAQYINCDSGTLYYLTFTFGSSNNIVEYLKTFNMFEHALESFKY